MLKFLGSNERLKKPESDSLLFLFGSLIVEILSRDTSPRQRLICFLGLFTVFVAPAICLHWTMRGVCRMIPSFAPFGECLAQMNLIHMICGFWLINFMNETTRFCHDPVDYCKPWLKRFRIARTRTSEQSLLLEERVADN